MRTHNLALLTVVFLVVGGLLSGFSAFKGLGSLGLIEERAASGLNGFSSAGTGVGSAFVQTAQGANLDASEIAQTNNAAFSSLISVTDLGGGIDTAGDSTGSASLSILYTSGAVKDPQSTFIR